VQSFGNLAASAIAGLLSTAASLRVAFAYLVAWMVLARLASRQVVPAGAQVQVHPAALQLDLIDLALAVVLAPGLECQARSSASRGGPGGR
jgi:hypothetical protein